MNACTRILPLALCAATLLAAGCNRPAPPESENGPDDAATPPAGSPSAQADDTGDATRANAADVAIPPHYASMDLDADGGISTGEHATSASSTFIRMDANGDGLVGVEEMDAAEAGLGSARSTDPAARIRAADADGDGQLSREEHARGARTMFDQMDADRDGRLTGAEIRAVRDDTTRGS